MVFEMSPAMSQNLSLRPLAAPDDDERLDGFPEDRIRNTDYRRLDDTREAVKDVLHLLRRDFFATALDEVATPAQEVTKAFVIHSEDVARIAEPLAGNSAGSEPSARGFSIPPVAPHDVPAARDELPRLPGAEPFAPLVLDPDLRAGDRDSHRTGPLVELLRRKVKRPFRLRQAVHRVDGHPGKATPQLLNVLDGNRRRGVRDIAQAGKVVKTEFHLKKQSEERRHPREPRPPGVPTLFSLLLQMD